MFSKNKKYYHKGVTLVELLVVIAIIGIMTGVGLVSLQSSRGDANIKAAQGEVAAAIRVAQSYALQGKMQGNVTPCEYGFKFTTQKDYQIFYKLPVSGSCSSPGGATSAESFVLNNDVVLSSPDFINSEIIFRIPFGNISGAGVGTFTLSYSGGTKTVTVNNVGNVTEEN